MSKLFFGRVGRSGDRPTTGVLPSALDDSEVVESDPVDCVVRPAGGYETEAALLFILANRRVEEVQTLPLFGRTDLEVSVAVSHDNPQGRPGDRETDRTAAV